MRTELCAALVARAERPDMVFLTGDLGFMALEPLRDRMGPRFINCGVAEQNMVGVAAGLAREGLEVWVYTIAPFAYARAFEQIRNDLCLHGLPVRLLGNGGGYGYGVMGPTHHALEDYGALMTLRGMTAFIPAFNEDIAPIVARASTTGPTYIRLGRGELQAGVDAPVYAPWRNLIPGDGPVVLAVGPLAGVAMGAVADLACVRPDLWVVSELPQDGFRPPASFVARIAAAGEVCVIEEHVGQGGVGTMLATWALREGVTPRKFRHLHALGYPSGLYGSQSFHRQESGLDAASIRRTVLELAA